jgi:hypothetical protein
MEGRSGAVVPDISGRLALRGQRVEALEIGRLVDETTLLQHVEEIGLERGHLSTTLIIFVLRYLQRIAGKYPEPTATNRRAVAL